MEDVASCMASAMPPEAMERAPAADWHVTFRPRGNNCSAGCISRIRQTSEGSFSAVSKPNFARKYAFESFRRDLQNALLCTALKSHFFQKMLEFAKKVKF